MGTTGWIILLMLGGLLLAVAEVFVPSGGVLGVAAIGLIISAILVIGFEYGPTAGFTTLSVAIMLAPIAVYWLVKLWPRTPIGRRIVPELPTEEEVRPASRGLDKLIGKAGRAATLMVPSGAVIVEGRTYPAVSEGMVIEMNQPVRVIKVRSGNLVVRIISDGEESPQPEEPEEGLGQSIDALGLEPLDDLS